MPPDQAVHFDGVVADNMLLALNNHLGRINRAPPADTGIGALTVRMGLLAKHIGPADIIPIIHVKSEREHILPRRQLMQESVRRRAARTALRGEKLDHNKPVVLSLGRGGKPRKHQDNKCNAAPHRASPLRLWSLRYSAKRLSPTNQGFARLGRVLFQTRPTPLSSPRQARSRMSNPCRQAGGWHPEQPSHR